MRSIAVSIFFIGLCIGLALALGAFYVAIAIMAAALAISTGVYMVLAVGVGLVWPVLVVAFVTYVTRNISRAEALQRAGAAWAPEARLTGAEDAEQRERRNQR